MRNKTVCFVGGFCLFMCVIGLSTASPVYHIVNINSTNPVAPYVYPDNAATNIQDAIDVSAPSDIVIVGPGAYMSGSRATPGASLMNRVVATNAIIIEAYYGPAYTMIIGSGPNGDSAVRCAYLGGGATLSGFTLTNGYTRTSGDSFKDCSGGGAYASGGYLANCVISGNAAATNGGGVCRGTVMNCAIYGNNADSGGGACAATLNSCLLVGNTASSGGGANAGQLYNCTVCGNTASSGGGTYQSGVYNSIVYYNSASANTNSYAGSFSYSCVVPDPGGTGDTVAPPQFVNYPNNLHLALGSPCIDSGDNDYVFTSTDLDGNSRIMNGTVDMGAYESIYVNVGGQVTLDYSGLGGVTISDGTRSNVTDASGSYTIANVPQGSYTLTPRMTNYIFHPPTLSVSVTNSDVTGQNFVAERFHVMAAINCGGPSYTDSYGTVYAADADFSGGTVTNTPDAITNTDAAVLYQSGRQGGSYSIPLINTNYLVTLKFAEIQYTGSAMRVFDVLAGGSPIATNLDIFALAGGHDRAYDIARSVTVTNGALHITFNAHTGSPLINAILVVLDETGLVTGPNGTPTWWLRQYGLTNNPIAVEELRDVDGDGMAAWQEYFAGTDPTNKASRLYMSGVSQSVSGRLQIAVSTVAGKPYQLQVSTNLVTGRWAGSPYATTQNGAMQSSVITASVATTVLYVLPSNTLAYSRVKLDIPILHPSDAVAYGGHFYKVFIDTNSSWHDMKAQCEEMGGYLACVASAGEQSFLTTLANGRYLAIGGTDEGDGTTWTWVNGSPWTYTDWATTQPNHSLGVEFYLELYDSGQWNDVADTTSIYYDNGLPQGYPVNWMPAGYICEWDQ